MRQICGWDTASISTLQKGSPLTPSPSSKTALPRPAPARLWTEHTCIENALAVPGLEGSQLPVLPILVYHHCPCGQSLKRGGQPAPLQHLRALLGCLWAAFRR